MNMVFSLYHKTTVLAKFCPQMFHYLIFIEGIAQGSKISPLLCNLYLGHIERTKFPDILADKDSLLLRLVDDPLLLTYNLEKAKRYLASMLVVDPADNCKVNINKCLVSFDATTPAGDKIQKIQTSVTWIPWIGLLINRFTLEVKYNYSKTQGNVYRLQAAGFVVK